MENWCFFLFINKSHTLHNAVWFEGKELFHSFPQITTTFSGWCTSVRHSVTFLTNWIDIKHVLMI